MLDWLGIRAPYLAVCRRALFVEARGGVDMGSMIESTVLIERPLEEVFGSS